MPKPLVFQYPTCSTCRNALAYLNEHGVEYDSVDIVEEPPSRAQLGAALKQSGLPVKRFFNTAGQSYRDGNFGERLPKMTESEALDALAADGKLIKRPLVLGGDYVLVGFNASEYAERFA
jgi:arsenate reductase (glutaredoxin)